MQKYSADYELLSCWVYQLIQINSFNCYIISMLFGSSIHLDK
jgi:hypothetical protein